MIGFATKRAVVCCLDSSASTGRRWVAGRELRLVVRPVRLVIRLVVIRLVRRLVRQLVLGLVVGWLYGGRRIADRNRSREG